MKPRKPLSWIFRIIQTTAIDYARKKRKYVVTEAYKVSRQDWSKDIWSKAQLESILYRMNPKDRAILCLSYLEGYTNQEIAHKLSTTDRQVAVMLTRARKRGQKIAKNLFDI